MMNEFSLIEQFRQLSSVDELVSLGIGDDAAAINIPDDQQILISTDTLVDAVHFLTDTPATMVAEKAVAVNVSDIAAMGGRAKWFTLALTLPDLNAAWLKAFQKGLQVAMQQYSINLIGGDITRGPLAVTIQMLGLTPKGKYLTRSGAQVGDHIFVSGTLGDAGYALQLLQQQQTLEPILLRRLQQPTARTHLGFRLLDIANSCIDISDGLAQDLSHILKASHVGACVEIQQLPLSTALKSLPMQQALQFALSAGDDYELCFSVSEDKLSMLKQWHDEACPITEIGRITKKVGLQLTDHGQSIDMPISGFRHFQ